MEVTIMYESPISGETKQGSTMSEQTARQVIRNLEGDGIKRWVNQSGKSQ